MRRLWPAAAVALVLLAACGGTDRPEGVVERCLIWGIALGISAALVLLVALVMALMPRPVALPTRPRE